MASTKSTPITVRLPNELVAALEAEAEALEMSRSEAVARRLRRSFSRASDTKKLVTIDEESSTDGIAHLIEDEE